MLMRKSFHCKMRTLVLCVMLCFYGSETIVQSHYSQTDPCAALYNTYQAAKVLSDAAKTAYNQKATEAAIALSTATAAATALAALEADRRELEGAERAAFIIGGVSAALAPIAAAYNYSLANLHGAWKNAKATTDTAYQNYLACRNTNRRDCDGDGARDDCINTTHTATCSCNDSYGSGGRIYERSCGCEAKHPH